MSTLSLASLLREHFPALSSDQIEAAVAFYAILLRENELQNLTRLVSQEDFVFGHLSDAVALLESGFLKGPSMDLGSGCGVPGLLCAALFPSPWVLVDSEARKADYLSRAASELGLSNVRVVADRGENWLRDGRVSEVVARAVGPVGRIFGWLRHCSAWNSLVLLKGPGWVAEWEGFSSTPEGKLLKLAGEYQYRVGPEQKQRVIVRIERVPRGTKRN